MAEIIFNGYAPNEVRVRKERPRASDQGHAVVVYRTQRRGSDFSFDYRWTCECGQVLGSRSLTSLGSRFSRHVRDALAEQRQLDQERSDRRLGPGIL